MTGRDFDDKEPGSLGLSDDDVDLLADYLAGVLSGTPAEAEMAGRIRDEQAMSSASDALARAAEAVSADLAAWGRVDEPMPADVAGQISDTLASAGAAPAAGSRFRDLHRVRPWLARRAGALAVAASVLAFCGFGMWVVPWLGERDQTASDTGAAPYTMSDSAAPGQESGRDPAAGGLAGLPAQRLVSSGVDYRRSGIDAPNAAQPGGLLSQLPADASAAPRSKDAALKAVTAPAALGRLTAPAALDACLAAIGATHPHPAVAVQLVDFASFESSPALVVVFVDTTGTRWVWAAGPGCGLPGVGADTLYRAKVG